MPEFYHIVLCNMSYYYDVGAPVKSMRTAVSYRTAADADAVVRRAAGCMRLDDAAPMLTAPPAEVFLDPASGEPFVALVYSPPDAVRRYIEASRRRVAGYSSATSTVFHLVDCGSDPPYPLLFHGVGRQFELAFRRLARLPPLYRLPADANVFDLIEAAALF